ncbi:hypothetical protein SAMN05216604_10285 [Pseudomonas agarici]|nr:hypothetical protein SAMN05216604_10285 [Pseudomonas agarici]
MYIDGEGKFSICRLLIGRMIGIGSLFFFLFRYLGLFLFVLFNLCLLGKGRCVFFMKPLKCIRAVRSMGENR